MNQETNWAGNYTYRAARIHRPTSIDEVQRIVANAARIHGLGTRHTFNDIADSAELISLEAMNPAIDIDREAMTVTTNPGIRYGILAEELEQAGLALHNMGSLPHISVGGATATSTHGSGDANGNLSSAVASLEMVTSDGDIVCVKRGDPDFAGMVVHLGVLGIVTRITLDIQPSYRMCQEVFERLPWSDLEGDFEAIFSSGYSVSVFPPYRDHAGGLWIKQRLEPGVEPVTRNRWGGTPAEVDRHPVDDFRGDGCTIQRLEPGAWCDRLPHFRLDAVPASGEEIQTEYMVDRTHAVDVIRALREFEPEMRDLLIIGEIRSIAADDLWQSTAYGRETIAFHFSWKRDQVGVDRLLPRLEAHLEPFDFRPHWGKAFALDAATLELRHPRLAEFRELRRRLDPRGAFVTPFVERCGLV